jgi:acyl-CoA synthetase (AMP-forming)/AMP-acid ligase II
MFLLGRSNTTESAAGFVGAAKAGVVTVPFRTSSLVELEEAIERV